MPSALFPFATNQDRLDPKLNVTLGTLPAYIDAKQPPTKKAPWRQTTRGIPFAQSATLVFPDELYRVIWEAVQMELVRWRYAKVVMKLGEVLDGDFFTRYVKRGNVLMLSEGVIGVDDVFSLRDGVLRLELSKEVYERAGLQGRPVRSGGRKHVKARYLVEIDLRQPSMLHGKKGFERIVWAARNVLNHSLVWLFLDLENKPDESDNPIQKHHPSWCEVSPQNSLIENVLVPSILASTTASHTLRPLLPPRSEDQEIFYDIVEWLDMVTLDSPRVRSTDTVDPYISRYRIPDSDFTTAANLRVLKWHGFLSSQWITQLLITVIRQSRISKSQGWLALTTTAHRTEAVGQVDGYAIVLQPDSANRETAMPVNDDDGDQQEDQSVAAQGPSFQSSRGFQRFICFEMLDSIN